MPYRNQADISEYASPSRLRQLLGKLEAVGCATSLDPSGHRLELTVPAGEQSWMQTGRITSLLFAFDDIVSCHCTAWHLLPEVRRQLGISVDAATEATDRLSPLTA